MYIDDDFYRNNYFFFIKKKVGYICLYFNMSIGVSCYYYSFVFYIFII